jgi:diacylglycerol kinase family enzyme
MPGIGVIVNPRARQNLRDPRAATRLARTLGDHGVVRTANSHDELARIAEDFRKLEIDVLGISGGDGTNGVTLTGFLKVYADEPLPPVAFLRGGTMNTVANAVGVPRGRPDGLLAHLIERYAARQRLPLQSVERHVLRVGDHYAFLFGTGALQGYIREYYSVPEPNAIWAAKLLARASASVLVGGETARRVAPRWEGRVRFEDGTSFPDRDYFAIACGTVDQIGLGFRPFYRFDEQPGCFHVLGIHTTPFGFVRKLPAIWRARSMGEDHALEKVTRKAVLEPRSGAIEYMCDGDLYRREGPLELATGPRVRILVAHEAGPRPLGLGRFAN